MNIVRQKPVFHYFLVFKLGAQHVEHVVNGLFLKVCLLDEHLPRGVEHGLGSVEPDGLDCVDDPLVYLVGELVMLDTLAGLRARCMKSCVLLE